MKKTALITGGAKRIGREISLYLASLGYDIALHYNSSSKEAEVTKKLIEEAGRRCELFKLDFNENSEINLIEKILEKFDTLDLLINNSSIFLRETLLNSSNESFNNIININLKTPYILTRDFGLYCKRGNSNGVIINIIDSMVKKNNINYFIYSLSKKGLRDLTLLSAKELAPNIRVNGIALGFILKQENENLEQYIEKIPLKELGNTDIVKETISFIIENRYLTGDIIFLDGGYNL